jgi:diacylglycerol kinase (ATP)
MVPLEATSSGSPRPRARRGSRRTAASVSGKRVLLAVNVQARRGRRVRDTALAALRGRGHDVTVPDIRSAEDMTAVLEAHRGRVDVVAVGGGDGTLVSAIPGVRALDVPLAILPLGTINELARTLAIPFAVDAACALLDDGVPRRIDVAHVNGFWFFNEASVGLSTHVAREQTGQLKSRWGMLAIPIATLRAWRNLRPYKLTVESVHGTRTFRTVQLTIANSYRFGGVVENPDAAIDDGMLDLYAIDIRHWRDALPVLRAVARRNFPEARNVDTLRSPWFRVRGPRRHRVFADGERATLTPAEFRVEPAAIAVLVPR